MIYGRETRDTKKAVRERVNSKLEFSFIVITKIKNLVNLLFLKDPFF
jgi:hypothetical protein